MLELLAPGAFMLWLGLSALLVGVLSFVDQSVLADADLMFAVFAVAAVPAVAAFCAQRVEQQRRAIRFSTAAPTALVGREFTLEKPIVDGIGTVRIDDTIWRVAGPDCAGRQPRQGRAGRWRQPDGGGGLARGLPAPPLGEVMQRQEAFHAAPGPAA